MWDYFTFDLSHCGFDHNFYLAMDDRSIYDMDFNGSTTHHYENTDTAQNLVSLRSSRNFHHISNDHYDPTVDHGSEYDGYTCASTKQDNLLFSVNNSVDNSPPVNYGVDHISVDHISIKQNSDTGNHDLFLQTTDGNYEDIGTATENLDGGSAFNTVIKSIGSRIVTYTDHDGDGLVDAINEISSDGTTLHYDLINGNWVRRSA